MKKSFKSKVALVVLSSAMALTPIAASPVVVNADTDTSGWDGLTIDTSWYNTTGTSFTLSDEADLAGLAKIVNGTGIARDNFYGKTVNLSSGVVFDLNGYEWTPIGKATITSDASTNSPKYSGTETTASTMQGFAGTFNGNGDSITELSATATQNGYGLFGYVTPAGTVKSFTVSGTLSGAGYDAIGSAAGYNSGNVNKVTSNVTVNASTSYNVGGIVGFNDNYYTAGAVGVVQNSKNLAPVTGKSKTGGIVGENAGIVSSCSNAATAPITSDGGGKDGTGGIVGRNGNNNTAVEEGSVKDCYNRAAVSDSNGRWVGGIVGFQNAKSTTDSCYNTGSLTAYKDSGAIVGKEEGTTTNYYTTASTAVALITADAEIWKSGSDSWPELKYAANETNDPAESVSTASDFYLGGTSASDDNTGLSGSPVATLATALEKASASSATTKTIHVASTVTLDGTQSAFGDSNITVKWDGADDGAMFIVEGTTTLGGMKINGVIDADAGTKAAVLFKVNSGATLKVRNNANLSGAETAIDVKAGGALTLNRSSVTGTSYAIKLAGSTSTCTMSVGSNQQIALGGKVYLGTGATIAMGANPATMFTNVITLECQSTASSITVAVPGTGIEFDDDDIGKILPVNSIQYQSDIDDSGNIIFAVVTAR